MRISAVALAVTTMFTFAGLAVDTARADEMSPEAVTCTDFIAMAPADQASIAAKLTPSDAKSSGSTAMAKTSSSTSTGAAPMVSAGAIVAARQAAPKSATIHDIISMPGVVNSSATSTN